MMRYSVVITYCCNRVTELQQLVKSVKNQTVKPSEILVITDGPAKELGFLEDDLLKIIMLDKYYRPAPLRNKGISASKMDLIFISDDDDYWHPMKAEIQLNELIKQNAALCFTHKIDFRADSELETIENSISSGEFNKGSSSIKLSNLIIRNQLVLSSVLINRSEMKPVFNENIEFRAWEDYELWLRLAKENKKIILIKEPLLFYRINLMSIRKNSLILILKNQLRYGIMENTIPWILKPLFIAVSLCRLIYWKTKRYDIEKI